MGVDIGQLTGEVSLEDHFSEALELVGRFAESKLEEIEHAFGAVGIAAGVASAAIGITIGAITTLGMEGSKLQGVEDAFDTLAKNAGTTGHALRESLTEGVKGTVDEMQLMQSTMKLMNSGMKVTTDQAEMMGSASRALGKAMGTDAKGGLELMSSALATGRTRGLSMQIGLIDVKKGEEEFAKSIGATAKELNAEGQLEGKRLAILEATRSYLDRVGDSELSFKEKIQQAEVAVEEWFAALSKGVAASPQVNAALDAILNSLRNAFGGESQSLLETILGWINKFADVVTVWGPKTINFFVGVKDVIFNAVSYVISTYDAIPQWFFNIAEFAAKATIAILATSAALTLLGTVTGITGATTSLSLFSIIAMKTGDAILFVKQSWVAFSTIITEGIALIVGEATGLEAVFLVVKAALTGPIAIVAMWTALALAVAQVGYSIYKVLEAWQSGQDIWTALLGSTDNAVTRWLGLSTVFGQVGESIQGLGIDVESMSGYVEGAGISALSMAGYVDGLGNAIETATDAAGRFNDTPLVLPGTSEIAETKGFFASLNLSLRDFATVVQGFVGDALKGLSEGILAAFKTMGEAILGIIDKVLFGLKSLLAFIPGLGPLGKVFDSISVNVGGLTGKINSAREALHNLAEGYKELHPELAPQIPTHAPIIGSGLPHETSHGDSGDGKTPNYLKDGDDKLTAAQKAYNAALLEYNSVVGKDYLSVLTQVGNATYEGVTADLKRGVSTSALALIYGTTTKAISEIQSAEKNWNTETNKFTTAMDNMSASFHGVPWDGTVEGALKLGASIKDVAEYFGMAPSAVKALSEEIKTFSDIVSIEAGKSVEAFEKSLRSLGTTANSVDFKQLGSSATEILKSQKDNADFAMQQSLTSRDAQLANIWQVANATKQAFADSHQGMTEQQAAFNASIEAGAQAHVDALKQDNKAIKDNMQSTLLQQAAYDKKTYDDMAADVTANYAPSVLRAYADIAQASYNKANGILINTRMESRYNIDSLQDIAKAALDTYNDMIDNAWKYTTEGIAAAKELRDQTQAALGGIGDNIKLGLSGVFKDLPNNLMKAFQGGGGILGAAKALGIQLADAIVKPMLAKMTTAQKAAVGVGASVAGAVGGNYGGTVGATIGATAATIGGAVVGSAIAGSALAGTVGGAIALGAATAGIGLAAVGAYIAIKKIFSLSNEYKAARAAQIDIADQLFSIATEAEKASAPLQKLDKDGKKVNDNFQILNTVARDAFLNAGYSAAQAEVEVKKLLDTKNVKEFAKAMKDLGDAVSWNAKQVEDLKNGTDSLVSAYQSAGSTIPTSMIDTIKSLLTMKGLTEDERKALQGVVDDAAPNYDKLTQMAATYGISLDALGPKFQQMNIESTAKQIFNDFTALTQAGADVGGVLSGMSDEISKLVDDSIKFGTAIPDNMKPLIKNLSDAGKLTDANGDKITDISQIKFEGTPLDQGLDKLNKAIDHLAEVLGRIPGLAGAAGSALGDLPASPTGPTTQNPRSGPPVQNPNAISEAAGGSGRVTVPTFFYSKGNEDFAFSGEGKSFTMPYSGGNSNITPNTMSQSAQSTSGPIVVQVMLPDGRVLAEAVVPELPGAIQRSGLGR